MSKVRNIVYGLALGDAIGFRVEDEPFERIVNGYASEDLHTVREKMWVSDDTTMSLYLMQGIKNSLHPENPIKEQMPLIAESIARSLLEWFDNPDCLVGRGHACKTSLLSLKLHLEGNPEIIDFFHGSDDQSKGSGAVMRSPWLGVLHAKGILNDLELENLCTVQSLVTHRNLTAIHSSYLVARIVSALYAGETLPGSVKEFAEKICFAGEPDEGWDEIIDTLKLIEKLPADYKETAAEDFDPSSVLGYGGTSAEVLSHAIAFIDYFGHDPVEVLKRSLFTGGDSDTIGAIAGAMAGASNAENVWNGVDDIIEDFFIEALDSTVDYLNLLEGTENPS